MKKLLIGCAAAAALFSLNAAEAADLARPAPAPVYKAPAMVPPAFSWTGLYFGLEGGYGWGKESYNDNGVGLSGAAVNQSPEGGIFGGVLGLRYQIGQFVLGVEGSAAWADINSSVSNATYNETLKARSLYTVTGQAGFAINQALLYVKGGWAGASVNSAISTATAGATNTQNDNGWTVGAGLDYAVWQNVVLGLEYDHIDLGYGGFTAPFSNGGNPWVVTNTSHFKIDQVVGRLTYKFNLFQ